MGRRLRDRLSPWRTLRGRLTLAALAGLVVAAAVFAAVGTSLIRSEATELARSELDRQARSLASIVSRRAGAAAQRGRDFRFIPPSTIEAIVGPGTRVYLDRGTVPLSPGADAPYAAFPDVAARQVDYATLERRGVQRLDFVRPDGVATEASAAPIRIEGIVVGAVLLSRPPSQIAPDPGALALRVAMAAGIGLVVALALSVLLTARSTRPLRALRVATRRVGRGDRRVTLPRSGTGELDELADAFNAMVRELARSDAAAREFLMRVTHDLRTPLTAIRGHSSALADGVVPPDDVPRSLAAIQDEAARLEALVADLLDLARLDARRFRLDLTEVEPGAVLERAADAVEAEAAARGVRYERELEALGEGAAMVTDQARLRQIVSNLLDNALRWTPPAGTVRLVGRPRPDGGLVVVVSDTGPGIAESARERIFEPFQAAEGPDGRFGSGLGLAISRQLARELGGDLGVESREGAGSRFTLELPGRAPQAQEAVSTT